MAGLLQNLLGVFSFLAILILSFASSRATQIEILNNCTYTIWAAAYPGGGRQLKHGEKWTLKNVTGSGRIWGRTKCAFGRDGRGKCESGDCNRRLECQSHGRAPNTVAEYSLNGTQFDVIHISVVEGFNIPMEVRSIGSAIADASLNCNLVSRCAADVNGPCPMELRDPEGCNNPCTVFGNSQFCCTSESGICQPTSYSMFFRALCLNALTYPFDLKQSSCPPGTNYKAVFCPSTIDKSQEFYESHDFLLRHNNARAEVGVMALTWNTTLESYAREYANKRIGDCSLVHSGGPYGENLAWSSGNLSSSNAVEMWVHEKANYDYNSNSCAPNRVCGHYTQVVWRDTVNLGCARVQCYNNMGTFIICTYSPPGNYVAQRPY